MIDYEIAARIAEKRIEAGLNQSELARKVGVTPQAVQSWEKGVLPRGRKMNDIAAALGTTAEYLLFGKSKKGSNAEEHVVCSLVPMINYKQAADVNMIRKAEYNKSEFKEWVPCPVECGRSTFAFTVRGDSMMNPFGRPSFFDGDIIYVDPSVEAVNNSLVVAKVGEDVFFRRLIIEGGKRYLMPLNPTWPGGSIEVSVNDVILGSVIYQGIKP
ncbi:LexA family protein [Nitrosomonas communis]|uniref:LexA family protein n=1 Tax=Nitrosomonas communis TaxID=44574 RepID=UPI003D2D9130